MQNYFYRFLKYSDSEGFSVKFRMILNFSSCKRKGAEVNTPALLSCDL